MTQAALHPATAHSKLHSATRRRSSSASEQAVFGLCVLMLCLLPLEWVDLPFHLKVVDFALVLLTFVGLAKAWRTRQRFEFPLLLPMWLILLASLIATLTGFVLLDSIVAILQEVYLFIWFLALTNILSAMPSSNLDRLMKVWSVIASAEAATTLMGMLRIGPRLFYTSSFEGRVLSVGRFARAVGTYVNPNAASAYLSIGFFVLLATSWPIWLRSVLGIWILAGMLGTGSLAAYFSTIGSLAILLLLFVPNQDRRTIAFQGGIVGIGTGILGAMVSMLSFVDLPLFGPRSGANSSLYDLTLGRFSRSLATRFALLAKAWSTYSRYPWGTGPNSSISYLASLHNDYAAFLFERGPLGAMGWIWIVSLTLLSPLRAAYTNPDRRRRWPVMALGSGFLACAAFSFTHEISHFRQVWVLMAFIFSAVHAYSVQPVMASPINAESKSKRAGSVNRLVKSEGKS